jgi:hypothetical protein
MEGREAAGAHIWDEMRNQARDHTAQIISTKIEFRPRIAWFSDYDGLFNGNEHLVTNEDEILSQASEAGRVLVAADAGSGKTWILARLARAAALAERIPVWISLRDLPGTGTSVSDMENILRALVSLSHPPLKEVLRSKGWVPPTIILADGLNEASREYIQPTLEALDELARRYPFVCAVVTDRLARRPIALDRWRLATVLPLDAGEIERVWMQGQKRDHLPTDLGMVSRPFFLDKALEAVYVGTSSAATLDHFWTEQLHLDQESLDHLSTAAFRAYQEQSSRVISAQNFCASAGDEQVRHLKEAGVLVGEGEETWFSHHLFHDHLAARHLVQHPSEWGTTSFDQITLGAASFDALRLAVEQITDSHRADHFIALVYDWNYSAAGYSLVEGRVSSGMTCAILAMLAEKRWDRIRSTVDEVTDALRLNGSLLARKMLAARDRAELIQIVERAQSDNQEFDAWRKMFSLADRTLVGGDLAARIRAENSLEGWALANSLRRCSLDQSAIDELERVTREGSEVARWRAVHAIGTHPNKQTSAILLARLNDNDNWVRSGAVRSLVEQCAISGGDLGESIVENLIDLVQRDALDDRMRNVLAKSLNVWPMPAQWPEMLAPLIQQLVGAARSLGEQERWASVMRSLAVERNG